MKKHLLSLAISAIYLTSQGQSVTVDLKSDRTCTMSNGIITLSIDAKGMGKTMKHEANGTSNILASNGIYFDYTTDKNRALSATEARIAKQTDDYAEVVYKSGANPALPTYEHGYILRAGESGVYTYVVVHGNSKSGDKSQGGVGPVKETRVCTRLASDFLDGYVDDQMQGMIPSNSEMATAEKNQVQDATYYLSDGSIYTKYNWAQFIDRDDFHGLMNGKVGVWNIPVSYEWINGGPMRQELTVHATSKSPITIQMLQGEHLGASSQTYSDSDHQIFGPFMIYVNSGSGRGEMIADARAKAAELKAQWPFQWFNNQYYPLDRATVEGKINITTGQSPANMQVVLASPSCQRGDILGMGGKYIYWGLTDETGSFSIPDVRKGDYRLIGYATEGIVTDELEIEDILVNTDKIDLGEIDFTPNTFTHQLWNIGENNRMADGFHCSDWPRAYEAWQWQPANLEFTIGESDPKEDWYNAQTKNGTWTVKFNLDREYKDCKGKLTFSIAGVSNSPTLEIAVNGRQTGSHKLDDDGSIRRSATLAGRHRLFWDTFPSEYLQLGENTVTLTASNCKDKSGILYDCIKMEVGEQVGSGIEAIAPEGNQQIEVFSISGIRIGTYSEMPKELPSGLYIVRSGSSTSKIRF